MPNCQKCNDRLENGCIFCNPNYTTPSILELFQMDSDLREIHMSTQFEFSRNDSDYNNYLEDTAILEINGYDVLDFDDGFSSDLDD